MRDAKQAHRRRDACDCGGGSWNSLELVTVRTPEGVVFGQLQVFASTNVSSADRDGINGNDEFRSFPFMRRNPSGTVTPSDTNPGGRRTAR